MLLLLSDECTQDLMEEWHCWDQCWKQNALTHAQSTNKVKQPSARFQKGEEIWQKNLEIPNVQFGQKSKLRFCLCFDGWETEDCGIWTTCSCRNCTVMFFAIFPMKIQGDTVLMVSFENGSFDMDHNAHTHSLSATAWVNHFWHNFMSSEAMTWSDLDLQASRVHWDHESPMQTRSTTPSLPLSPQQATKEKKQTKEKQQQHETQHNTTQHPLLSSCSPINTALWFHTKFLDSEFLILKKTREVSWFQNPDSSKTSCQRRDQDDIHPFLLPLWWPAHPHHVVQRSQGFPSCCCACKHCGPSPGTNWKSQSSFPTYQSTTFHCFTHCHTSRDIRSQLPRNHIPARWETADSCNQRTNHRCTRQVTRHR